MAPKRQRFAARRKAVGYSQEQFAERVGVERSTVVRWESGESEPQPWLRPKIARTLQVSLELLDELLAEGGVRESDIVERVDFALRHPTSVDLVTVGHLRHQVQQLDERCDRAPSISLLAEVGQYLGQVGFLSAHVHEESRPARAVRRRGQDVDLAGVGVLRGGLRAGGVRHRSAPNSAGDRSRPFEPHLRAQPTAAPNHRGSWLSRPY